MSDLSELIGGGGGGAWTFVNSTTITSPVTTIDITGMDSTYDMYVVQFVKVGLGSTFPDQVSSFRMVTSSNGGSTFDSGTSDYAYASGVATEIGTSLNFQGSDNSSYILVPSGAIGGSPQPQSFSGLMYLAKPSDASDFYCYWNLAGIAYGGSTTNRLAYYAGSGRRKASADVDAIRFTAVRSSTNNPITGGTVRLFGINNS